MSTKTYDKKTAAFAGFLIQNIPADLDEEMMDNWMQNPQALKRLLAGLVPTTAKNLFTKLGSVLTAATTGKPTKDCFTGSIWRYRDPNFDARLAQSQPKRAEQSVTVVEPKKPVTFIEFAQAVLGVTTNDIKELGNLLIVRGHTLTLEQAEALAERTEAGEVTGLVTNGYANAFFAETGNKDVPVAVADVSRLGERFWRANDRQLVIHFFGWLVADRLLLCNADTLKL